MQKSVEGFVDGEEAVDGWLWCWRPSTAKDEGGKIRRRKRRREIVAKARRWQRWLRRRRR